MARQTARSGAPRSRARRRPKLTARTADRYDLYQRSVQEPEADVRFVRRIFRNRYGREPRVLREDFCGTAVICCEWVRAHRENRAVGVDLDPEPLAWGRRHNLAPLRPEQRQRVELVRGDVRRVARRADVVCAFNFSYYCFKSRDELRHYFAAARRNLGREGLLVLDAYGGPQAQQRMLEPRDCGGFDYVWDQDLFDPISHETRCYIHFEFRDGSALRRAFAYDWRLWTLPEIRELLGEAGFRETEVYWEGTERATNEPNGVFTRRRRAPDDPAWIAYLVGIP